MRNDLLTPEEVAEMLSVSTQTLASWRTTSRYDLPFIKIGRLVRYRKSAVDDFLDECDEDESEDEEALDDSDDGDDDGDETDDEAA